MKKYLLMLLFSVILVSCKDSTVKNEEYSGEQPKILDLVTEDGKSKMQIVFPYLLPKDEFRIALDYEGQVTFLGSFQIVERQDMESSTYIWIKVYPEMMGLSKDVSQMKEYSLTIKKKNELTP